MCNEKQSSTECNYRGCYSAWRAIDNDWYSSAKTKWITGTHWWQASLPSTTVHQVKLQCVTHEDNLDVEIDLYKGETLVGHCESYTFKPWPYQKKTLDCDRFFVSPCSSF